MLSLWRSREPLGLMSQGDGASALPSGDVGREPPRRKRLRHLLLPFTVVERLPVGVQYVVA
ncbi:MAG: hypothetical protein NZ473_08945, partial [Candidatus Kapabacteria bacterium]|nr:hypothetical protein [Candidatus Kapabacteria bacterium]MDW8226139.1 hypothetical protein [Bacteroidota bacterium]